jgi:hypothetical protein
MKCLERDNANIFWRLKIRIAVSKFNEKKVNIVESFSFFLDQKSDHSGVKLAPRGVIGP